MIHLCVVWRRDKWVVTSSDTVTFEEKVRPILEDCRQMPDVSSWKDSEIIEHLNEGMKEVVKQCPILRQHKKNGIGHQLD